MSRTASIRQAIDVKVKERLAGGKYLDLRQLFDLVADVLADGTINSGDLQVVVEYTEELFELYVRPYDIPGIGPIIEKRVDDILKGMIRPALAALFDMLDGAKQPTDPTASI